MRFLSAELIAAQKAHTRRPYLKTVISDRLAGLRRLRPSLVISEPANPDEGHAAIVTADLTVLRVRFDGATLYRTAPNEVTWISWATFIVPANCVALAKDNAGKLWCFVAENAEPPSVLASTSTDNGTTWSAFALAFLTPAGVAYLAASGKTGATDIVVLVAAAPATAVSAYRYTGAWAAAVTKTGLPTITGLALVGAGDWNTLITGSDATGSHLQRLLFGDGFLQALNTWSSALTVHTADIASNIALTRPFLGRPDVIRATFRQQYTGAQAYDRTMRTNLPATAAYADDLWREPVPLNITAPYGVAISFTDDLVLYTTARYLYTATLVSADLDVTADVLSARLLDRPLSPVLSDIVLDNSKGTYTDLSASVITKGAQVQISPGCLTSVGNEASYGPGYHIDGLEHTYEKGRATLRLILGSQFTHMARHRFPRAVVFAEGAKYITQQIYYICARVGYEATGGSSASGTLKPPLILTPGTSALTAIRRALERVPDTVYARGEFFSLNEPLAADAADATYDRDSPAADQRIEAATYGDHLKDSNHIQVFAEDDASIVAEDLDYAEIDLLYAAPLQRHDPFLDTGAEAVARAAAEQRRQVIQTTRNDTIVAPVHCGLEVSDVIAVTDARHGLTAAKRRVLALELNYQRGGKPRYHHTIRLGAP